MRNFGLNFIEIYNAVFIFSEYFKYSQLYVFELQKNRKLIKNTKICLFLSP